MAHSGYVQSVNCQTLIVIQVSPHDVQNRNKKSVIIQDTCSTVFALLNSPQGGNLKLSSSQTLTPKLLDQLGRAIEQSLIEVIGMTNYRNHCQMKITGKEIVFNVNPSDRIFTVSYNLFLPANFLVREILRSEPLVNIAHLLKTGPLHNSNLKSFIKEFRKDTTISVDEGESDRVQFKEVKSDRNKNKSLADRIIANKITHYVSAFANHKGGHVYIGIDDETYKVSGQSVDEEEKSRIIKRLDSAIKNMVWPEEHGKPTKGIHWDIEFVHVLVPGDSMEEIPGVFIIVISIGACPGGVFLKHPETYEMQHNKVAKMEFRRWKRRVLHDAHMQDIVRFSRENSWPKSSVGAPTIPGKKDTILTSHDRDIGECSQSDLVECTTIPKSVSRIVLRNTKSRTMCFRITDLMEKLIQDGDFEKVQKFASKISLKREASHNTDIEVATRLMLALAAYRRRSFSEGLQELSKASALVASTDNSKEFEIQSLHLLACFHRGQGHYDKSYEITHGGLQQLETITPGWYSAWMLSDAGYLFSNLAGEERNKEVRQSLKQQAVTLYTQAIEHTKLFGEDSNKTGKAFQIAKSNLLHRCHLRLAMLFLGCASLAEKDDAFRDVTADDLDYAVNNILAVEESVLKGDKLTVVNDCYLSLAKSDLNYRRSQTNVVERGENYHERAVEWATKALNVAKKKFPGIVKYAQSRLDRLSEVRSYRNVEEELLADLDNLAI